MRPKDALIAGLFLVRLFLFGILGMLLKFAGIYVLEQPFFFFSILLTVCFISVVSSLQIHAEYTDDLKGRNGKDD